MYYSYYLNEKLLLDEWDYYDECNWLLTHTLAKDDRKTIKEKVDFYYENRNERYVDDKYTGATITFSEDDLTEIIENYNEYCKEQYYYDCFMDDLRESGEDVEDYTPSYQVYTPFQRNEFMERIGKMLDNPKVMNQVKENGSLTVKTFDWLKEEKNMSQEFVFKMVKNAKMGIKIREINEVIIYKSDLDAIEKARKDYRLTELEVQVLFGLIFFSRMNDSKFCRVGTKFKFKSFISCFDKTVTNKETDKAIETGLFNRVKLIKEKIDGLHIKDELDYEYLNFDNKDEVAFVFKTTKENNKLNLSELSKEVLTNLKSKYCSECGCEFTPASNRQKMCIDCKEEVKREQSRLRQQRFREKKGSK